MDYSRPRRGRGRLTTMRAVTHVDIDNIMVNRSIATMDDLQDPEQRSMSRSVPEDSDRVTRETSESSTPATGNAHPRVWSVPGGRTYLSERARMAQTPCRYFFSGTCRYGTHCRFSHDEQVRDSNTNTSTQAGGAANNRGSATAQNNGGSATAAASTSRSQSKFKNKNNSSISKSEGRPSNQNHLPKKSGDGAANSSASAAGEIEWAMAPEFVPYRFTTRKNQSVTKTTETEDDDRSKKFCPNFLKDKGGNICYDFECPYKHGNLCDMCSELVLHPTDKEQQKRHLQDCLKEHEKDMELSFALARSREKTCGICFEVVVEKNSGEHRFGILPNCNHCFCLVCLRTWRRARQFENNIIRACPECRVTSDFVCPSLYWYDTKEEKDKLISDYKEALAKKDCKYFKKGASRCPFGNKCFYRHAMNDGTLIDVGPPQRQRRRTPRFNDIDVLQQVILWEFFEDNDNPWDSLANDLEDLVDFLTDTDDSDWSEYE